MARAIDVLDQVPIHGVSLSHPGNPVVFLDVAFAGEIKPAGRIKIELYSHIVPKTAENFRQLCTGEARFADLPAGYLNTVFHRVVPGVAVYGGDVMKKGGEGTFSIYGDFFDSELPGLHLKHDGPGVVSVATPAKLNRSGCQFLITLDACAPLDSVHVVLGRVVDGLEVVQKIGNEKLQGTAPIVPARVVQCGEL